MLPNIYTQPSPTTDPTPRVSGLPTPDRDVLHHRCDAKGAKTTCRKDLAILSNITINQCQPTVSHAQN
ncbi:hypothetical protein BKA56DRAFT_591903 [Ilyonectria sp. MPI-CAGE-AT-0026]|nr:hypothetical protein BKA56DRAFT_591903 [Ilyonectria sp. MPI-CAGE-AT-0026]